MSDTRDFDEFVKRQQQSKKDWSEERDQWLHYLDALYSEIEAHLQPYIDGRTITLKYRTVQMMEEKIGSYTARQLLINIGQQQIVLRPIGTLLIGTKGRVDIEGPAGRSRLVLADRKSRGPEIRVRVHIGTSPVSPRPEPPREIDWVWKIATNPPNVRYIDLTRESLFQTLMEVSGG